MHPNLLGIDTGGTFTDFVRERDGRLDLHKVPPGNRRGPSLAPTGGWGRFGIVPDVITPAGRECRYYYEDFHRGRATQECRLILANAESPPWRPRLCFHCPVPDIMLAPGVENLALEGTVERSWLGLRQKVAVTAVCTRHLQEVPDPRQGCPACAAETG